MKLNVWLLERYASISQACGVAVILISVAALVGWLTGSPLLKGIRGAYIPMAPNTALVFALVGVAVIITGSISKRLAGFGRVIVMLAAVLVAARMSEYLTSLAMRTDPWMFRFPSDSIGFAPAGKMAFVTALTLLLLLASLFLFTFQRRWAQGIGHGLSIVVAFIGTTFCLGYLYGAPLMYGGRSNPMALNTAICFLLAGSALMIKGTGQDIEERRAAGLALKDARDELEARVRTRTAELAEQQQYLRAIVETSPNPIFVKNAEGRFILINKAVELAYGRSGNEILGKKEADLNGYHTEIQTFIHDDDEVIRTLKRKFIPEEELTNPKTGETDYFKPSRCRSKSRAMEQCMSWGSLPILPNESELRGLYVRRKSATASCSIVIRCRCGFTIAIR
jgi:PAS domain-containing protein